jgi:hypothetical protein
VALREASRARFGGQRHFVLTAGPDVRPHHFFCHRSS